MSGIGTFDLEIQPQDFPESFLAMFQESHRVRCNQDGFHVLTRDLKLEKSYSVIKDCNIGEVRSNYYPYGVSDKKYPYDSSGVEIRGVRFLLVIPERNRIFKWIHSHSDYRIIIRHLKDTKGYFPDLSHNDVFEIITIFIKKHMADYEFVVHPVTYNKAKRALREFNFDLNGSELLAVSIMLQKERIIDMRQGELEKGLVDAQITKDMEVLSRMIGRLSDIENGSLKDTTRKIRNIKLKKEEWEFDQTMLKNQEDDGINQRELLESSESRIIDGLANLPESVKAILKDQGSRRKIMKMVDVMRGKDRIEVVQDKDLGNVVSNRITLKTQEVTYSDTDNERVGEKDVEDDDIIVI